MTTGHITTGHMTTGHMTDVRTAGARVEEILGSLRSGGFGPAAAAAEELTGLLVGLYGDGLAAIVRILADSGPAGAEMLAAIAGDPQVEGLLLLHDLHPLDIDARIQRALDQVRPYLGSHAGGVQYLGVTGGVARLRLEGSCHGCPSSTVTVELAITTAIQDAAPEVDDVVVEGMTAPPEPGLLQIGRRPPDAESAGPVVAGPVVAGPGAAGAVMAGAAADGAVVNGAAAGASWVTLPPLGPPSSRPLIAPAGATSVLLCSVRGTLYAYRDACAACGASLAEGELNREELACPACGRRYNVRLAGQGIDDPAAHLDPLPLLSDSQGVRVAVPEVAAT